MRVVRLSPQDTHIAESLNIAWYVPIMHSEQFPVSLKKPGRHTENIIRELKKRIEATIQWILFRYRANLDSIN